MGVEKSMLSFADQIVHVAQLMFDRKLTDLCGGNISVRDRDQIICTPRYAGSRMHWNLSPTDLVTGPIFNDVLLKDPSFSREGLSHLVVYRAFPGIKAIIHAHPHHVLPFCAARKPIVPVIKATEKYGTLNFISDAPNYSQEQADSIISMLRGQEERIEKAAAGVLMPKHGIFMVGADLYTVLDAVERIDTNAWCMIAQKLLS